MKAAESTFRTGELNEFDRGFQVDMDNLIQQAYGSFDQSASFLGRVVQS